MPGLSSFQSRPLSQEAIEAIIVRLLASIRDRVNPTRVIVFGSASRGEMTDLSDIDVVVIFSSIEEAKAGQSSLFAAGPLLNDVAVDVLVYDESSYIEKSRRGGVAYIASREGRVVYERGKE